METPVTILPHGVCPECGLSGLYLFVKETNCIELSSSGTPINAGITDYLRYLYCPSCKSRFRTKRIGESFKPVLGIEAFIDDYKTIEEGE